ncbi:DUF4232 domain-containing protein [Agrococcus jejuensis]|nr:DUF4232 domain-containing protein [Agrococcus jejuensis]
MHRSTSLAIASAVAVLALAGCAGGAEPSPSPTPSPSATSSPTASPSPSPSASPAPEGACTASDLAVTQSTGDAGAGSVSVTFAFENVGVEPCTLAGFPGVSAVGGGDGEQLGQPADRSDLAYDAVELPPGVTATAAMRMVNVAGGGGPLGEACAVQDADGWRVYPPDSTEAIFVAVDGLQACAGDVDWITIDPIVG